MPAACPACHRLNPVGARYCHHDGVALAGGAGGAPIAVGSRPFLAPFVFPSGRTCRTFDELVRGCEVEWPAARDMLRQGFFEGFLGGLGRGDLAQAARQAAREADPDLALDQFLARLPGQRTPPTLTASPREINLGVVPRGQSRTFSITIDNAGAGLLCGTARSEVTWLTLGGAPGTSEKHFQCLGELTLPVQVRGGALRASPKPQEGRIVLDDGSASVTVVVRVVVPVKPFPNGLLAGAETPRQLASKARDAPRESAPLFVSGAVARWYADNGWTYPVQGPAASGKAAVQQFFEALGVTKPPRLTISQTEVDLDGPPGGSVEHFLIVETPENRPVYARAVSETDWLEVPRVKCQGASARVHLRVPRIPPRPGQRLVGRVVVFGNGNQRFPVRVALQVHGVTQTGHQAPPVRRGAPEPQPVLAAAVIEVPPLPSVMVRELPEPPPPPPPPPPEPPPLYEALPLEPVRAAPLLDDVRPAPRRRGIFFHLIPLGMVLFVLGLTVVHDVLLSSSASDEGNEPIDPRPVVQLRFHDGDNLKPDDKYPKQTMMFGLADHDPDRPGPPKRLMFDELGRTNNVCIRVDGQEFLFGHCAWMATGPGEPIGKTNAFDVARWIELRTGLGKDRKGRQRDGARSLFRIDGSPGRAVNLDVIQTVEVVPGEQSGRLDTCLVRYTLHNRDRFAHDVGLRFLLDTYIGGNDGVPFTIPGQAGLCSTWKRFNSPQEVPDYIQALEKENLLDPGLVAHVQFRLGQALEPPGRVLLGGWPDGPLSDLGYRQARGWLTGWEVPLVSIRELVNRRDQLPNPPREPEPDSAVTLYWLERRLEPDERRQVGFSYGLGQVASGEGGGKLLLSVGGRTVRGGEFSVTALRRDPERGERLTLRPEGPLELIGPAEQPVPPVAAGAARAISTVTWRLRSRSVGHFGVSVESSTGLKQRQKIRIHPPATGVLD